MTAPATKPITRDLVAVGQPGRMAVTNDLAVVFGQHSQMASRFTSSVTSTGIKHQRGSTLLVALIMLVLLTLVAVSAINSTSTSIQIVGNAQFREEATAAAQQAIENVISNTDFQTVAPVPQNIDVNHDGVADYTVTFAPAPSCLSAKSVVAGDPGVPSICASSIGAVCYWTMWDVRATVSDISTGASLALHQGIQTIAGLNAAVTACGI